MNNATEDAADIFDDSLFTLFAVPPIAFSPKSPDEPVTYTPPSTSVNPSPITLYLPQPPPNLYATLQANQLWLAGVYLADLLATRQLDVANSTVAELGAAAGLPGIVARRDGEAAFVVSSDWGVDEVLDVTRRNFTLACGQQPRTWSVVGHRWGSDTSSMRALAPNGFDILLLADTLWVTEAHSALLDSVWALLRRGTGVAHITAGLHTGRGPIERFVTLARERGARVESVREVRWRPEGGWAAYEAEPIGLEEERGVVVYYTLHL